MNGPHSDDRRGASGDTFPDYRLHTVDTRLRRVARPSQDLRALIVAPDPESRDTLERLCRANGLQPLPTADTGLFALRLARMLRPDLLLVDSDLSDMNGLDLLEKLSHEGIAGVVVTRRTDLAIRAFETGALDYLLKPVSDQRFAKAMDRARARLPGAARRTQSLRGDRGPGTSDETPAPVLIGERQHRMYLLDPSRVDYIEAQGNYVTFHTDGAEYLSRDTLKRLELTLQPRGFLRIEHSLLLNVGAVDYVVPFGRGRFVFTLRSGISLRSTPTYRAGIVERLPLARSRREVAVTDPDAPDRC
jgi:two-component system, LytTR family, response regulator